MIVGTDHGALSVDSALGAPTINYFIDRGREASGSVSTCVTEGGVTRSADLAASALERMWNIMKKHNIWPDSAPTLPTNKVLLLIGKKRYV